MRLVLPFTSLLGGYANAANVLSGGSYLSSNDMRVHFGLSDTSIVDQVENHWPSAAVETLRLPAVDRILTITEGKGIMRALCTGCKSGRL